MRRLTLLLIIALAPAAFAETVRLAVVVGNNAGAGNMPPLRFAESDAGKFARVLLELGDVTQDHLQVLQGRSAKDLEAALTRAREQAEAIKRSPENRVVLLFYFSGHSDGEGLEIGREVLPFTRLKSIITGVGDVRVVVVDACKSGAGFREKGGKQAEPFAIKMTDALQSTGDAFISSSAENEAALESQEVLGSIFTHHFISGMRGVADSSGDRIVTLGEAYRYAYDQTVSRTTLLPAGAQHPTYDYNLTGQGELVMATLQRATSQLLLPQGFERAVVSDVLRDQVVAEVPTSATREVALPAGQYGLRVYKSGQSYGGRVAIAEGTRREVKWEELSPISSAVQVAAKGGLLVAQQLAESDTSGDDRVLIVEGAGASTLLLSQGTGMWGGHLGFDLRQGPGFEVGLNAAYGVRGITSEWTVDARVGWRYSWRLGPVWLGAGAEVGGGLLGVTPLVNQLELSGLGVVAPKVGARLLTASPLIVTLEGRLDVLFFSRDGFQVRLRPTVMVGFGFRF